jgi:hypothetical protein
MKKIVLPVIFFISGAVAQAQVAVTSLYENFDASCATALGSVHNWYIFNPVVGTFPDGAWKCDPQNGTTRSGSQTPGLTCSGYYNGSYHLDTSILMTPKMNLSSYTGKNVYLQFDSRSTNVHTGARMAFMLTTDTVFRSATPTLIDLTDVVSPAFDDNDSAAWVTHQVDLSGLIHSGDFFMAFRYTSTDTSGKVWYLDNVRTITNLETPHIADDALPLTVLSTNLSGTITFTCTAQNSGNYELAICDMMGRRVHHETINITRGTATYTINNVDLNAGMYILGMSNQHNRGISRFIIP